MTEAESRYGEFYQNASDGLSVVDADGLVIDMNATQLKWLGYSPGHVSGRTRYEDYLAPEDKPSFPHLLERCRRDGSLKDVEVSLLTNSGDLLPVRLSLRAVHGGRGRKQTFHITARDISTERELEGQLLQAQKMQSLGTLVAGIAHDFNNVLTGILGYTQLLMRELKPEGRVHERIRLIELLSERAADMIQQLLAYGRGGVGRKRSMDLHPFLKETSKLLTRMIPENIQIELDLAPEELAVEVDPTQLLQVVINLATNARDAMKEGGRLRIETARAVLDQQFCKQFPGLHPGAHVRLAVSDTGAGIPPAILPHIFDTFYTTKGKRRGTGLGLPMVASIVKSYGGAVQLDSRLGHGTTVLVYLPLAQPPTEARESPVIDVRRGSGTILLAEDEAIVLALGQATLEHFGYRVLTARDGREAIEVFQKQSRQISLVILDVVMPKLGGLEVLKKLKQIDPNVKVLFSTGYSGEETTKHLLQGDVCGLVKKPFRIHELAEAVRAALQPHGFSHHEEKSSQAEMSRA